MDRRNSDEGKQPHPNPNPNPDVFDDENALDPDEDDFMPSVADGFRPANSAANNAHHDSPFHDNIEPLRPQMPQNKSADASDLRRMATRNSIAKVPYALETSLQNASQRGAHQRGLSSQATPLQQHRASVSSTASFATMANSDSPFSSGPSHPYGMYPQNTMVRNASISTAATEPQHQASSAIPQLPSGPSHPYGMYTQNVVEDEPPVPAAQTAIPIPVGFPGINNGFHRQIGPDGEEQDIVGPDGHTEQLPPYSRYPEEGPTKASMAAEASATPVDARSNPLAGSNDTLLIDVSAPIPPAPPSPVSPVSPLAPSAALLPQQRPETQSGNVAPRPATTSESASLLTTTDSSVLIVEKAEPTPLARKQSWRKKRLWGKVPVTVALCLLILLLIFAIVLGAAIGTFLTKNKEKNKDKDHSGHDKPELAVNDNTLFGATPIATPTGLPALPTGRFALPLGYAQESSPGCLLLGNQYSAWSCKMSFAPLEVVVNSTASSYQAALQTMVAPDGSIQYGLQPPAVGPLVLQLVEDLDYRGYGPAWHFSGRYDKVVVLQPDEFAAGNGLRKRDDDPNKPPSFRHRFQVMPGDNPWYCIWNSTYIEGYIYAKDNSSAATMTSYPSPNPTDPFAGMMSPTSSILSSSSSIPSPTTTTPPTKRSLQGRDEGSDFRMPFPYPRIVKIEERRLPGAPQPYCQKMQLLDNGQIAPASGSNGGNVIVWLQESDPPIGEFFGAPPGPPSPSPSSNQSSKVRRQFEKRSDPSDACHCQWMFQ